MKKKFLMLAAIGAVTVSFTACSSEDALTDSNENERGVVKAEFTISLPQKVGTTRMSAATVQAQGQAFRGIRNIELYPFTNKAASEIGTTSTIPSSISLLSGATAGPTGSSSTANHNEIVNGSLYATNNSHL